MTRSSIALFFAIPVLVLGGQLAVAQTNPTDAGSAMNSTNKTVEPDNTKSNREDPSNMNQAADRQPNNTTDMDVTQRIRQQRYGGQESLHIRSQRENRYSEWERYIEWCRAVGRRESRDRPESRLGCRKGPRRKRT